MTDTNPPRRIGRSILALLAGMLVGAVLTVGTDKLLKKIGVYPSSDQSPRDSLLLLATGYRVVYGVLGSYITARLAPSRPIFHVLLLGVLGTILGLVGVVVTWGRQPALGHEWYPVALTVLAIPQSWIGGFLFTRSQSAPR